MKKNESVTVRLDSHVYDASERCLMTNRESDSPPLRILIVCGTLSHYRYGVYRALDEMPQLDVHFAAGTKELEGVETIPGTHFRSFYHLRNRYVGILLWQFGLVSHIFRYRYDAVVLSGNANHLSTWVAAAVLRTLGRKCLFWTIGWHRPDSGARKNLRIFFYRLANHLMVYSPTGYRYGIQAGYPSHRMTVIFNATESPPMPTNTDYCAAGIGLPTHERVVGAVTRLTARKNFQLLLDAAEELQSRGRGIHIVLAGDGPERDSLVQQAAERRLPFTDFGAVYLEAEISRLYCSIRLTVVPSRIGLAAIQSLRFGVPVVSDNNSSWQMPEWEAIIPGVNGDLFVAGDVRMLADKIDEWLERSAADRRSVEVRCRESIAQDWTVAAQAEKICNVLATQKK